MFLDTVTDGKSCNPILEMLLQRITRHTPSRRLLLILSPVSSQFLLKADQYIFLSHRPAVRRLPPSLRQSHQRGPQRHREQQQQELHGGSGRLPRGSWGDFREVQAPEQRYGNGILGMESLMMVDGH